VQGAVGAVIGTVLGRRSSTASTPRTLRRTYRTSPSGEAVLFGLLISVTAQVGDLVESLLKRDAGVKDSGTLFPGHGGALDRVDSLLFTLPVGYLVFRYLVGAGVTVLG
jgi:phosphatidate cytidylyltransferase